MKSALHLAIFLATAWGCTPSQPTLPTLLPVDFYTPTLAAATLMVSGGTTPSPNNPVNPVNPSNKCENCNGTGKIPARPDHPEDPTKQTCPVCGGSGVATSKTLETPVGPVPQLEASSSTTTVSNSQGEEHPFKRQGEEDNQPPADDYKEIDYVPIETALAEAERTGKPIWIHCTDLKACRECIRLERQVLNQKDVIKQSRNFVCVQLLWDHPWRPRLIGETAVPLDCFGSASEWKNLKRYLCAKTVPGYVNHLVKVQGK
jgi:hypothetical protein